MHSAVVMFPPLGSNEELRLPRRIGDLSVQNLVAGHFATPLALLAVRPLFDFHVLFLRSICA